MSTPTASRAAPTSPTTLADVLAAIAATDLPERRKQDLASAVRSAARALGRSAEQVPADPRLLASRLTEIAPQAVGFSKARWNNVRSLLRAALETVTAMAPGRHPTPLTQAHDRHLGGGVAQRDQAGEAGRARHLQVEQDHVQVEIGVAGDHLSRLIERARLEDFVLAEQAFDDLTQRRAEQWMVVGDKRPEHQRLFSPANRCARRPVLSRYRGAAPSRDVKPKLVVVLQHVAWIDVNKLWLSLTYAGLWQFRSA
jgi:hypothetical protein